MAKKPPPFWGGGLLTTERSVGVVGDGASRPVHISKITIGMAIAAALDLDQACAAFEPYFSAAGLAPLSKRRMKAITIDPLQCFPS